MEVTKLKDKTQVICDNFAKALLANDSKEFLKMMAEDCEWNLMATGEQFTGIWKVRKMAEQWIPTRHDIPGKLTELSNKFAGEDHFCIQYVHRAAVTDKWPSSVERFTPGTMIAINICIVCQVNNSGMISRTDEYFDLGQLILWGPERELYS
jgi:ketosteroid isomerase-like protein